MMWSALKRISTELPERSFGRLMVMAYGMSHLPDQCGQFKEAIYVPVRLRFAGALRAGQVFTELEPLVSNAPELHGFML